jgi:hypothetical protein
MLAAANPLSYPVDALRAAIYADTPGYFGLPLSLSITAALAAAAFLFGIDRNASAPA